MVQVRVLGPVSVIAADGREFAVIGPRLRSLLALLALRAGTTVPTGLLIDGIWDGDPPARVENALQALVSRLRAAVGSHRVVKDGTGYLLAVEPDAVDACRFDRLLGEARRLGSAGRHEPALRAVDLALAQWRSDALAGVVDSADMRSTVTELTERRLAAIELRADLLLTLGRAGEALPELAQHCTAHPFRETLAARRITALAAAGRKSEAFDVYRHTAELVRRELGAESGPALQAALTSIDAGAAVESDHPPHPTPAGPRQIEPDSQLIQQDSARSVLESAVGSPESSAGAPLARGRGVPRRWTSFVDRGHDLDQLTRTLRDSALVTLTGTGGVGKTRLATELAAVQSDWPDGCVFADLAGIAPQREDDASTPTAVPAVLLSALGIGGSSDDADWRAVLHRSVGHGRMLVILDNCEHVIDAAAELAAFLLCHFPLLTVLATSREPLGVDGENLYPVRALAVPEPGASVEVAAEAAAVQLFVDRARAVRPDFRLTDSECADIVSIVCCLDGLPLAIELAAARLHALPVRHLADRLPHRFRLLDSLGRNVSARHRTLHAVVSWSWNLLTGAEVELARRLAVFADGATLDAILAVCGGEDTADTLTALVAKSLVEFDGARYRMVETIRAYAASELDAAGESRRLADAHADHFLALVRDAAPRLLDARQQQATRLLTIEHANCLAALEWAVRTGDGECAVGLYGGLIWHWLLCGLRGEALAWQPRVLALFGAGPPPGRAADFLAVRYAHQLPAYHEPLWWGQIPDRSGEFDELVRTAMGESRPPHPIFVLLLALRDRHRGAGELLNQCLTADDTWLRGNALVLRALDEIGGDTESFERCVADLEAAISMLESLGEPRGVSRALLHLAHHRIESAGLAAGAPLIARAAELLTPGLGAEEVVGVLRRAAQLHLRENDVDGGAAYLASARRWVDTQVPDGTAQWLRVAEADLALRQGEPGTAIELYGRLFGDDGPLRGADRSPAAALATDEILGRTHYAIALVGTGRIGVATRQLEIARDLAATAAPRLLPVVAVGCALAALAIGAPEPAARLLGAIDQVTGRITNGNPGPDVRQAYALARKAMGQQRFLSALNEGRRTPCDQVSVLFEQALYQRAVS
ncbi:BTAD domain-containing putative transcriptional regulator [Nocardia sp. NPDC059236]|uniref:AfsR/SARP family transcriptional regulator n=1 Tax=Nocardia sp. NPDC059236 TaxID=3346783 RepID=UPI003675A7BC